MNIQGQPYTQAQSQRYPSYIIGGGTIIALIGFLFLPYVSMSLKQVQTSSSSSQPLIFSGIQAASVQGFIWLEALLAVGILLVAARLAFSRNRNPFDMSRVAFEKQVQWGVFIMIGVGVVSLLLQYVLMTTIPAQMVGIYSTNSPGYAASVSSFVSSVTMSYNVGSWFYLLGMLAVIGGSIYALSTVRPGFMAQGQPSSQYIPQAQNPQMPWQQPQEQYPSQQAWQPQQEQYPPQQSWQPTQQQYPPQQGQQPYPPYPPTGQ